MSQAFGSFGAAVREPATPMQPVTDPAGWEPADIEASEDWCYAFTAADIDELDRAVDGIECRGLPIVDMTRDDFPLPGLGALLDDVRRELREGRGLAVLRGLPVADMGRERAAIAYFGIGHHLGMPISQNAKGHLLGHVKDFGKSYDDPGSRGYQSNAELGFHCDHADYVGLMCLHPAMSGGESLVASSVTLYNRMLAARPDLVKVLTEDFYWTRHGEIGPGQLPYYVQPVFSFEKGYFSARGASSYILKAQGLPGVPPFTEAQKEAIALYRETVRGCAAAIAFERGDIQFLNNHVMLHTRRAFTDWPEPERKRHLLRLWLKDEDARPVPAVIRRSFSGVHAASGTPVVPLYGDEAA